jgi:hypothetical protein
MKKKKRPKPSSIPEPFRTKEESEKIRKAFFPYFEEADEVQEKANHANRWGKAVHSADGVEYIDE